MHLCAHIINTHISLIYVLSATHILLFDIGKRMILCLQRILMLTWTMRLNKVSSPLPPDSWTLCNFSLWPKTSTLSLTVHRTCFQRTSDLFRSFAKFWHWILYQGHRKTLLLKTLPWWGHICAGDAEEAELWIRAGVY